MHPLKPLNVWGDGGAITTNDDKINDWIRLYRNHGMADRDHIDRMEAAVMSRLGE